MDGHNATALVTGGRTGVGQALTQQLLARGTHVIVVGREPLATPLPATPGRLSFVQADLAQPAEQDRVVTEVSARWPSLDMLFNNAGVQVQLPPGEIDHSDRLTELRTELSVNLQAPITLCLGLLPTLAKRPSAVIVNISSALGLAPKRSAPVYCASKAGLSTFSRALRYRCKADAPTVRVIDAVLPLVDTAMTTGRGSGKISADAAATAVLRGVAAGAQDLWIGKARALHALHRWVPTLAYRMLREQ